MRVDDARDRTVHGVGVIRVIERDDGVVDRDRNAGALGELRTRGASRTDRSERSIRHVRNGELRRRAARDRLAVDHRRREHGPIRGGVERGRSVSVRAAREQLKRETNGVLLRIVGEATDLELQREIAGVDRCRFALRRCRKARRALDDRHDRRAPRVVDAAVAVDLLRLRRALHERADVRRVLVRDEAVEIVAERFPRRVARRVVVAIGFAEKIVWIANV